MTAWEVLHRPTGLLLRDADGVSIGRVTRQGNDFSFCGAAAGDALHLLWTPQQWREYRIPELSLTARVDFSTGFFIYRSLNIREIRFAWIGRTYRIRRFPIGKITCLRDGAACIWMKPGLARERVTIDRVEETLRLPIVLLMLAMERFEDGLPD